MPRAEGEIDTFNRFAVGARGDLIQIMMPVNRPLSQSEALNLAAWIVAIAGPDEFREVLDAILSGD